MKRIFALALSTLLFTLSCLAPAQAQTYPAYYGQHGTAKFIGGRTVVVSIFADDAYTSWDFPLSGAEARLYNTIHERMGIGLRWLEAQVADYGVHAEFIWDFDQYDGADGLCRFAQFDEDLTDMNWDTYLTVWHYIHDNIDTAGLLSQYGADNIVYAIHLNAPNYEDGRTSFTFCANKNSVDPNSIYYETSFFLSYGHGRENTPALYAHEILHCFGAPDLYCASDTVPQDYVDYLRESGLKDLMNSCYLSDYDRVTCVFSNTDAYFVGLLDTCSDERHFDLGPNIFQRWQ